MRIGVGALDALDRGEYSSAVEEYRAGVEHDPLWTAHVAVYLREFERADEALEQIGPQDFRLDAPGEEGKYARRVYTLKADVALQRWARDEAQWCAKAVLEVAGGDRRARFEARLTLARVSLRTEKFEACELLTFEAERDSDDGDFDRGRLLLVRGFGRQLAMGAGRAVSVLRDSVEHLARTGVPRFAGMAYNALGAAYRDLGEGAPAKVCFESAMRIAREVDVLSDELAAVTNLAALLVGEGRYTDAIQRLAPVVDLERAFCDPLEIFALQWLAYAHLEMKQREEFERAAARHLECARFIGTDKDLLDSAVLCAAGGSIEEMEQAVATADDVGDKGHQILARLYLGRALVGVKSYRSLGLAREVEARAPLPYAWLDFLLAQLHREIGTQPITVTETALTFDTRAGFLKIANAIAALERFYLAKALEHGDGVASKAAQLLGVDKTWVSRHRRRHDL